MSSLLTIRLHTNPEQVLSHFYMQFLALRNLTLGKIKKKKKKSKKQLASESSYTHASDISLVSAKALLVTEVVLLFAPNRGLCCTGKFPSAAAIPPKSTCWQVIIEPSKRIYLIC